MFSNQRTTSSTESFSEQVKKLREAIDAADCIVIGAGAGLSTAAGFDYSGERFRENFSDFAEKYGFRDMYSGGFYPYETLEEHWAYWSRYIYLNRYTDVDNGTYKMLYKLVRERDYFVLTTNVDHQFQKAGFDKNRLFYTQGDYGLFQCVTPCHNETYDNEQIIYRMYNEQKDMRIPSELVPKCPKCGKPMTMNLRSDDNFVQDGGWYKAAERYENYLKSNADKKLLFLELGVGYNTPSIIKFSFQKFTDNLPNATYACINMGEAYAPQNIAEKSICIDADIKAVLEQLQ
jgi:NAD-dependent SIR2 family protein deacetylase